MPASNTRCNPAMDRVPAGYTHAIDIRNPERWLFISGLADPRFVVEIEAEAVA